MHSKYADVLACVGVVISSSVELDVAHVVTTAVFTIDVVVKYVAHVVFSKCSTRTCTVTVLDVVVKHVAYVAVPKSLTRTCKFHKVAVFFPPGRGGLSHTVPVCIRNQDAVPIPDHFERRRILWLRSVVVCEVVLCNISLLHGVLVHENVVGDPCSFVVQETVGVGESASHEFVDHVVAVLGLERYTNVVHDIAFPETDHELASHTFVVHVIVDVYSEIHCGVVVESGHHLNPYPNRIGHCDPVDHTRNQQRCNCPQQDIGLGIHPHNHH